MKDEIDAGERRQGLGPDQSVRVSDQTHEHGVLFRVTPRSTIRHW
jgi:hypothetical protein